MRYSPIDLTENGYFYEHCGGLRTVLGVDMSLSSEQAELYVIAPRLWGISACDGTITSFEAVQLCLDSIFSCFTVSAMTLAVYDILITFDKEVCDLLFMSDC